MKVFEVIVDYYPDDSEEIVRETQYVTSEEGTIKSVVDHFTRHCREYEKTLVGVREVLNITQHLTKPTESTELIETTRNADGQMKSGGRRLL